MELRKYPDKRHGFALVLAIALMSFILLLLLSIGTLMRVELDLATMNQKEQEARENARLGMMAALGQLRILAGPDQRVTATAEILNAAPNEYDVLDSRKGKWTGVWEVVYDENERKYEAELLDFLISGMPAQSTDPLSAAQQYTLPDKHANNNDYVELVGEGSASSESPSGAIIARKVDIDDFGCYAYWVGDEGVKARINLHDSDLEQLPTNAPEKRFQLAASPSFPVSAMDGLEDVENEGVLLENILSNSYISAINSEVSHEEVAARFHDITLHSVGIPTNTAEGGLKRDLSLAFEMSDEQFNQDVFFAGSLEEGYPSADYPYVDHKFRYIYNEPINPELPNGRTVRGPTWHVLRNFYRLSSRVQDLQANPKIGVQVDQPLARNPNNGTYANAWSAPSIYSLGIGRKMDALTTDDAQITVGWQGNWKMPIVRPTEGALTPVVTRMQNVFSLRKVLLTQEESTMMPPGGESSGHTDQVQIIWDPIVTLWNPYNVAITFDGLVLESGIMPFSFNIQTDEPSYIFYSNGGSKHDTVSHPGGSSLPPVHAESNVAVTSNHEGMQFEKMILSEWGRIDEAWGIVKQSVNFIIGKQGESITMQPGEILVYSAAEYDKGDNVMIQAEEGFDGGGGFAFNTGLTGSGSQQMHIRIDHRIEEYFTSAKLYLIKDWSKFNPGLGYVPDTNDGVPLIGSLNPYRPHLDEDTRLPSDENATIDIRFSSLGYGTQKLPLFQSDFYMKTSESPNGVALAAYNNPRARSTLPIGLRNNSKFKPSEPLWDLQFDEVFAISDVANADAENRGFWGESNVSGSSFVTLYEVPTAPLTSIGQFMHANVGLRGHTPLYPVGSSFASPFIPRDQYVVELEHTDDYDACVPDMSYLLNQSLWDGFFFSSLTSKRKELFNLPEDKTFAEVATDFTDRIETLPNQRMTFLGSSNDFLNRVVDGEGVRDEAYAVSAGNLGIKGAFNINSTSVEAWKSILSGLRDAVVVHWDSESGIYQEEASNSDKTPYSKFTLPNGGRDEAWRGYGELSDEQIEELAEAIVENIHERGPFPTLASFVNRELTMEETGLAGVLEASIQQTSINDSFYDITADKSFLYEPENINRYGTNDALAWETGIPGFLTQADILMAIGGMISNRSDTFIIRSYGESVDPYTGESTEAWLEAIVQRSAMPLVPESTDSSSSGYFEPKKDTDGDDLGRKFQIVSMRWLAEDEI